VGLHAEKVARLLRKGSTIRVQGRMTELTWTDKQSGATRYGAEIVAQTLDYQGANDADEAQIAQPTVAAPAPPAGRAGRCRRGAGSGQTQAQPQQESANGRGVRTERPVGRGKLSRPTHL
jgi:single-stranded DNA-binding protein